MMEKRNTEDVDLNTNPYPIYPDLEGGMPDPDASAPESPGQEVPQMEIVEENDRINPDENTLDRG